MPRERERVRRAISWALGIGLLAFLSWRIPMGETWQAVHSARLEVFLPLVAASCIVWFLLDAASLAYVFSRFNTPLSWAEARRIRGRSYLLTPIHWHLGRAAVIAQLHRSRQVPILEATSSLALQQTLDAILLSALAWVGLAQLPDSGRRDVLLPLMAGLALSLALYLLVVRTRRLAWKPLRRLRSLSLHHAHRQLRGRDLFVLALLKLAYYSVLLGLSSLGAAAVGIDLSFATVLVAVPIIQGIGALPLSPAGLGTQQATLLYLFEGHGSHAAILAFGLALPALTLAFRFAIGWSYLGRVRASAVEAPHEVSIAID